MANDPLDTPAELSSEEVTCLLGISPATLQRWEIQYDLVIPRRPGGIPVYTPMVVEVLQVIRRLRRQGKSLSQIRQTTAGYRVRLQEEGMASPQELPPFPAEKNLLALARRIEELGRQVGTLEAQNAYLRVQNEQLHRQIQQKDSKVTEMATKLQAWRAVQRSLPRGRPWKRCWDWLRAYLGLRTED